MWVEDGEYLWYVHATDVYRHRTGSLRFRSQFRFERLRRWKM